jgi:hypothetical protein
MKKIRLTDGESVRAERQGVALQQALYVRGGSIPKIYSVAEDGTFLVIVMEFVEGVSLHSRLGRLSEREAAGILVRLLGEIDRWRNVVSGGRHLGNVVHGDLKPEHVVETADGRLMVLDFGIAKPLQDTRAETVNPFRSLVYAPPERLRTRRVDQRADSWAAAVILYQLILGHPPFQPRDGNMRFVSTLPGLARLSAAMGGILSRALALDPALRYSSPTEFRDALAAFVADRGEPESGTETAPTPDDEATVLDSAPSSPPAPVRPRRVVRFRTPAGFRGRMAMLAASLALAVLLINEALVVRGTAQAVHDFSAGRTTPEVVCALYQGLERRSLIPGAMVAQRAALLEELRRAAEAPVVEFRKEEPRIPAGAWGRAQSALQQLAKWGQSDAWLQPRQPLVEGHLARLRHRFLEAIANFEQAAASGPSLPDPYLGLAVVYAYNRPDLTKLQQAQAAAAAHGIPSGRRSIAQLADTYVHGADRVRIPRGPRRERRAALLRRSEKLRQASDLYARIPGFAQADVARARTVEKMAEIDSYLQGVRR